MPTLRTTRGEQEHIDCAAADARFATERRRQIAGLLVLAAATLVGTVIFAGVRNVFLPGWWRPW